jgi:hypothetical protein
MPQSNLHFYTDAELLVSVWLKPQLTPMEFELAERLQRALDEVEDLAR